MKFKVGDKVRVIGRSSDLKNFRNAEGEIIAVNEKYREYLTSLNDDVWFEENELELIKSNQESQKTFQEIANEIGKFTDMKNDAYGSSVDATYEVMKFFLNKYKNDDNTYTIPESLLKHIFLQVRMIDKQNRIFNNPDGDKMEESPYRDLAGYSLIGVRMTENE
jgi:hypothetical protein